MSTKNKAILVLILLAPITAEVMSGSTPVLSFIKPTTFIMMICSYGLGALLIRDLAAKWQLQWSLFFLGCALGIVIEGVEVQSFFNPNWEDLNKLSNYAVWLGVQWVWTIKLITFHAFFSVILPITLVNKFWPEIASKELLTPRIRRVVFLIFVTIVSAISYFFFKMLASAGYQNYTPSLTRIVASLAVALLFVYIGYRLRNSRIGSSEVLLWKPFKIGFMAFLLMFIFLLIDLVSGGNTPVIIPLGVLFAAFYGTYWLFDHQIYHPDSDNRHLSVTIAWVMGFWLFNTVFSEFNIIPNADSTQGMLLTGLIFIIIFVFWYKRVARINKREVINNCD